MADPRRGALTKEDQELIEAAQTIIASNYEYERHAVGAAVRMRSGDVFTRIHIEATVGGSRCALRPSRWGQRYLRDSAGSRRSLHLHILTHMRRQPKAGSSHLAACAVS